MILNSELITSPIIELTFPVTKTLTSLVESEDWRGVDEYFLAAEKPGGELFNFMLPILEFKSIEHIISIRAPDDEDGIWHDDGSRILGFTISLTKNPESIEGGHLCFRKKGQSDFISYSTRKFGRMLVFKTGIYGYEHMVTAVKSGKRILIAGWCS